MKKRKHAKKENLDTNPNTEKTLLFNFNIRFLKVKFEVKQNYFNVINMEYVLHYKLLMIILRYYNIITHYKLLVIILSK